MRAGRTVATNRPVQLYLEVSSRCNLRCKKCGFSYDPSLAKTGRDLSWPILSRMNDFFEAAVEVYTFGYGEMFLFPELAPLVTVLKNHGCRTSGVTNGLLIRPADVVWLVATGYDQLAFSIDGATEETMERLRGASLAKILNVLRLIHEEKVRRNSEFPRIVVNFVVQNDNYRELPELIRLLAPLKIFFLGVNPLHHFTLEPGLYAEYYESYRLGKVPRADFEAMLAEAKAEAAKAGIPMECYVNPDFEWPADAPSAEASTRLHVHPPAEPASPCPRLRSRPSPSPPPLRPSSIPTAAPETEPPSVTAAPLPPMYCHYPWTTLYLMAAGTAKVCCYMSVHEDLGEFQGNVAAAWNGPQLQSVREHIREGRVHPACTECVRHRTFEMHAAAMNPIRQELQLDEFAPVPVVVQPQVEDRGLRRLLKRVRAAAGGGTAASREP